MQSGMLYNIHPASLMILHSGNRWSGHTRWFTISGTPLMAHWWQHRVHPGNQGKEKEKDGFHPGNLGEGKEKDDFHISSLRDCGWDVEMSLHLTLRSLQSVVIGMWWLIRFDWLGQCCFTFSKCFPYSEKESIVSQRNLEKPGDLWKLVFQKRSRIRWVRAISRSVCQLKNLQNARRLSIWTEDNGHC